MDIKVCTPSPGRGEDFPSLEGRPECRACRLFYTLTSPVRRLVARVHRREPVAHVERDNSFVRGRLRAIGGSIAADRSKRNYVKHVIDRYNEFAAQQPGRKFSFAAIYSDIKTRFGAKWDFVGIEQF